MAHDKVTLRLCIAGVIWREVEWSRYPKQFFLPVPSPLSLFARAASQARLTQPNDRLTFEQVEGPYYELRVAHVELRRRTGGESGGLYL